VTLVQDPVAERRRDLEIVASYLALPARPEIPETVQQAILCRPPNKAPPRVFRWPRAYANPRRNGTRSARRRCSAKTVSLSTMTTSALG